MKKLRQNAVASSAICSFFHKTPPPQLPACTENKDTLSEQTESNYTWAVTRINQMQQDMETAQEATEEQLAVFRTYMTFDEDGLVIGKTGNPFTFRVVNDRLAFYMNDTEVA